MIIFTTDALIGVEMQFYEAIATQVPFSTLDPLCRNNIADTFFRRDYLPGDPLIVETQAVEHVGFIVAGVADVCFRNSQGHEIVCSTLIKGDFFGELSSLTNRMPVAKVVSRQAVIAYVQSYDDFMKCINTYESLERFFLHSALKKLCAVYQSHADVLKAPLLLGTDRPPKTIKKAIRYIEERLTQPLSLEDVSYAAGMSRYAFSRNFRQSMGVTFKEYLNHLRVQEAKRLISNDGLNVSEACFAVGFNDVAYFSRVFRRIEGHSPSEYKKH